MTYNVQYKLDGTDADFETIVGENPFSLMLVVSKTDLATNAVYLFRYRIKNKYGWSEEFSPILSARTATNPSIVPSLSFSIIEMLSVRIGWT